jgi:hypothetical protein
MSTTQPTTDHAARAVKSKRKPHSDSLGYVCERKSHHPKLPGYFAIFDKNKGGDWVTGTDGNRWGLIHIKPDDTMGCVVCFPNLPSARAVMVEMCNGSRPCRHGAARLAAPACHQRPICLPKPLK